MSTYFVLYIQKEILFICYVSISVIKIYHWKLLLQKYFCKKDTCDQNENIYIDWLVINSKFKLKTVNSILHYQLSMLLHTYLLPVNITLKKF